MSKPSDKLRPDFVPGGKPRPRQESQSKVPVEKIWTLLLVLAASCLAVLVAWLLTSDRRATRQTEEVRSGEEIEALRRQSFELEEAFEKLRLDRPELLPEDIEVLARALAAQEKYLAARGAVGTDNVRLDALRRKLHTISAERLRQESDQAEQKAMAEAKTNVPAAIGALRRALEREKEIDAKWVYSGLGDRGRIARLDTRLRRLESEQLWSEGRALEKTADQLLAAGAFSEAAEKLAAAIRAEEAFLESYRDVRDTEFGRVDALTVKRDTVLSMELRKEMDQKTAIAEAQEKAGQWKAAGRSWRDVAETFGRLLARFPRSLHADRSLELRIGRRMNYALEHDEISRVEHGLDRVRELLRLRRPAEAVPLVADLLAAARLLVDKNTGAFEPADPARRELEFILTREAALRALGQTVDQGLVGLPGSVVRLSRQEVTQGLYASVMGSNPSALPRDASPVESVAYQDAQEFCQRLGWLLGQRVRLPAPEEIFAAAGHPGMPAGVAWGAPAGGEDTWVVRPGAVADPEALAVANLFGPPDEWLQSPPDADRAWVAVGITGTPSERAIMAKKTPRKERNRNLGFRIAIE